MVKKTLAPFGNSPVDAEVKKYFAKVGVDVNYVTGYTITRNTRDMPLISVEMFFDEEPAEAEKE
jgi:hypothetical protein